MYFYEYFSTVRQREFRVSSSRKYQKDIAPNVAKYYEIINKHAHRPIE